MWCAGALTFITRILKTNSHLFLQPSFTWQFKLIWKVIKFPSMPFSFHQVALIHAESLRQLGLLFMRWQKSRLFLRLLNLYLWNVSKSHMLDKNKREVLNKKVWNSKIDQNQTFTLSPLATEQHIVCGRHPADKKVNVIKSNTFTYLLH